MLLSPTSKYIPHGLGRIIYSSLNGTFLCDGYFEKGFQLGFGRIISNDGTYYYG